MKEQSERIASENQTLCDALNQQSHKVESLKEQLEYKSKIEKDNALLIQSLFKDKWSVMNMLCNEYFDMGTSEKTRIAILFNIEKELKKLQTSKSLAEIENAVNAYFDGLMTKIRSDFPEIKEENFVFLSLIFAGFSVRAVCLFMGIKYKLFYLKKSRLIKKIADSDCHRKNLYLSYLTS